MLIGHFVGDLGAAVHAGMVVIGEKLGLYKTLAVEPMNSAELALRPKPMNATCASGWLRKRREVMSHTMLRQTSSA